jgi:O-antigen/teichoic acid export membrane protein
MISQRLTVISEAINTVLLPHLARLHNPDPHHQAEIVLSMARWTLWITAALAGGVVLASLWLVPLAFGPQYQQVWLPLLILIPSLLSSSISRILAGDISARGRPELNALTAFVALTANIALNVALIPKYAALGAAAAMSLSYTLHLFLRVGLYQRLTGAPLRYFYISRYDALVWQRAQYLFKRPKT